MKLPVLNVSVSLNEIPDHLAVTIELGNCKMGCSGCHSPWCSEPIARDLWPDLEHIMYQVNKQVKQGANAIVLMGGTCNGVSIDDLVEAINVLSCYAPVGLYSGLDDNCVIHKILKENAKLTWLKTGQYQEERGGLDNQNTNQKFYAKRENDWVDITYIFSERRNIDNRK